MSNQSARNRRVQPSRADLRAEQSAQELAQENYATTRPVYREWLPDSDYGFEPNL